MRILVTGASGLIGSALRLHLEALGHSVTPLVRKAGPAAGEASWDPDAGAVPPGGFPGFDGVVHLAGEDIAARWTKARKTKILESRRNGTRLLAETLAAQSAKPKVLVSASAIGWYGDRGDEVLTERSGPGAGFLAEVCREWEAATGPARAARIRTVSLRFGVVLSDRGGALKKMLGPFKAGVGGRIGNGRQFMSWVAIDDVVLAIAHALGTGSLEGPANTTAPEPVDNATFSKTLGRVLRRPAAIPLPAFAVRLLFGEMGREILLSGCRVIPEKLLGSGFRFEYPTLERALRHVLRRP